MFSSKVRIVLMVPILYLAQMLLCQFKILLVNTWDNVTLKYLTFWVDLGFPHPCSPTQGSLGRGGGEVKATLSYLELGWHQIQGLVLVNTS